MCRWSLTGEAHLQVDPDLQPALGTLACALSTMINPIHSQQPTPGMALSTQVETDLLSTQVDTDLLSTQVDTDLLSTQVDTDLLSTKVDTDLPSTKVDTDPQPPEHVHYAPQWCTTCTGHLGSRLQERRHSCAIDTCSCCCRPHDTSCTLQMVMVVTHVSCCCNDVLCVQH
jgi:hypothetical protein